MTLFCIHAFDVIWWPYINEICGYNTMLAIMPRLFIDIVIFCFLNLVFTVRMGLAGN